jgi:hypothetical protein
MPLAACIVELDALTGEGDGIPPVPRLSRRSVVWRPARCYPRVTISRLDEQKGETHKKEKPK